MQNECLYYSTPYTILEKLFLDLYITLLYPANTQWCACVVYSSCVALDNRRKLWEKTVFVAGNNKNPLKVPCHNMIVSSIRSA